MISQISPLTRVEFWPSLGSETATSGALLLPFFGALEKGEGADGPAGPPWMNWMNSDRQILKIGPKSTDLSCFSRIFTTGIKTNICWKKKGVAHFSKKPTVLVAQPPRSHGTKEPIRKRNRPAPSISYAASTCIASWSRSVQPRATIEQGVDSKLRTEKQRTTEEISVAWYASAKHFLGWWCRCFRRLTHADSWSANPSPASFISRIGMDCQTQFFFIRSWPW